MALMETIKDLDISQMISTQFECGCGRLHYADIKKIIIEDDPSGGLLQIISAFYGKKIFLMADQNTSEALGDNVYKLVQENNHTIQYFVFKTGKNLVPDEASIGRLFVEMDKDTSLIIAAGSGSLNDMARFLSFKMAVPYIIIATAASMDGYASTVSPLIIDGFKTTYPAAAPYAVIGWMNTVNSAPPIMLQAGFGDVIGKYIALVDWYLSNRMTGEYLCEETANIVRKALEQCVRHAKVLSKREPRVIRDIFDALVLSGIAMSFCGNSRPASGSEHHLAHYWEMDALKNHYSHPLHGVCVGAASVVMASYYKLAWDELDLEIIIPDYRFIQDLLESAGCKSNPQDIGIPKDVFTQSLIYAIQIRPRYTIFHYVKENNLLEEYARRLTMLFYK